MCPCDTWTMKKVTHGKMNSRVRGSFLSLEGNQTNRWGRGEGKKKGKEKKKRKKKKKENCAWRRKKKEGFDSRCFDGQTSLVRELKFIYVTRATRGYQKLWSCGHVRVILV